MNLSFDCVLIFVLHSGVLGRLTRGSVKRNGDDIHVQDTYGDLNPYFRLRRVRSWAIYSDGSLVPDWSNIVPEDAAAIAAHL